MINHIRAILWKQCKDTVKNKTILIQFFLFPCMTALMENAVAIDGMPEHFFANLFAVMYVGMAPLTAMSAMIAEEKEKNTLRVLRMCNVSAPEYFLGNAVSVVAFCMAGSAVIAFFGGYRGKEAVLFLLIMFAGHSVSILAGAAIGALGKNQMAATSLTVPVMMALSFLPMLSMFNGTIAKVAKYVYSEQLYLLIGGLDAIEISLETAAILGANVCVIFGFFLFAYRRAFEVAFSS